MFISIAKKALLFALKVLPFWQIINWLVSILRKWVTETPNKIDDKALDTLEYVLHGIQTGDFDLGIDEWLATKLKTNEIDTKEIDTKSN